MNKHLQIIQRQLMAPWFAYLTLGLLQLKVVWGDWLYRDLASGDTAAYFTWAHDWFRDGTVDMAWSPLYTAFYGTLLHISGDAYLVTILHRLLIIFTVTQLTLALWRRLLPPGLAWLLSAWWAITANNFNVLYEVHLFVVIPVLLSIWLTLYRPARWARGSAVAILLAAAILIRNELLAAAGILALLCLGWEIWQRWIKKSPPALWPLGLLNYELPLLAALLLIGFFGIRSNASNFSAALQAKETLTFCQLYAVGYQQRQPDWTKNPWVHCSELMTAQFGQPSVSLSQALQNNPAALREHLLWNVRLLPAALQAGLFDAVSGAFNPKYNPIPLESLTVLGLSLFLIATLVAGLFWLYREQGYWWATCFKPRGWGWLTMLVIATTNLIMGLLLRANPEYIYGFILLVMTMVGVSGWVIAWRWGVLEKLRQVMPLVMLLVILVAPNYYTQPEHRRPRLLLQTYRRLAPFESALTQPGAVLLGVYAGEICHYVGYGKCRGVDYTLLPDKPTEMLLDTFVCAQGVNMVYVDEILQSVLTVEPGLNLTNLAELGWRAINIQSETKDKWLLLTNR